MDLGSFLALEFEAIWQEAEKSKKPKSLITDDLSFAIVKLNEELRATELWSNIPMRNSVLKAALPKLLLNKLGLETLLQRVPEAYMQAIFGAFLASRFGELLCVGPWTRDLRVSNDASVSNFPPMQSTNSVLPRVNLLSSSTCNTWTSKKHTLLCKVN